MSPWRLLVLAAVLALVFLAGACSGGGSKEPGAKDPETAVRNLLDAIVDEDADAVVSAINPIYSDKRGEIGVGDLIRLAELSDLKIEDMKLRTEYEPDRQHARVLVSARIVTKEGEAELEDKVLLTSTNGEDRWFVTSPNSEYWSAQLRPAPNQWQQVQADANPALPGTYVPPHPGVDGVLLSGNDDRGHFANDASMPLCTAEQIAANNVTSPLCYSSNPPTSGPHAASAAPFRVFATPVAKEFLVHSMEHGGVVIWYNSNDPTVIRQLTGITETNISRGRLIAMTFYGGMQADTVAVTAWTRLDKFPAASLDTDRIQRFINAHERRFNPEGF